MAKLDSSFPGFAQLDAAGEATEAKVRKRIKDGTLTGVPGIGDATAKAIEKAIADDKTVDDVDDPADSAKPEDSVGTDVKSEADARAEAISPALKHAKDEDAGRKLADSRLCFYDDPEGPFVAVADTVTKRNERIAVMPISRVTPKRGIEVYDGADHYALTEDMGVTNFGEPNDWLKIRSPNTGLALIR